ncbi:MAG: TonB family protein [Sphingomonadales bacterium]
MLAAFCLLTDHAAAGSTELHYAPVGDWVIASPEPTSTPAPSGAPFRYVYNDVQIRLGTDADETYAGQLVKVLTPDGLTLGNVALTWDPGSDDLTIHRLKVRRGAEVIDVLDATKFQIIQRENRLEYAMFDGNLTATLQIPGIQVGDEIEFAMTTRRSQPVFVNRSFGILQMPVITMQGAHRVRFDQPVDKAVTWKVTPDFPVATEQVRNGRRFLTYELRDPASSVLTEGAPARFNVRRQIEYSTLPAWADISGVLKPLFDQASTLAPDSPVRREVEGIASALTDPVARAEAVLSLVQEQVRYVYVGLDGGNYRPESADDTWQRRFGDCKAKTALLLAMLRELDIAAEAALVDVNGGDGMDQRLPNPILFNHVVVKAVIDGKVYWLDGTRLGDRSLGMLPPPPFRWALALGDHGAGLEPVAREAPLLPEFIDVLHVDASAGYEVPAKVSAERIYRGDGVFRLRTALDGMASDDARRAQDAMWRDALTWVVPSTVDWRYDQARGVVVMRMSGEGKLEWLGEGQSDRALDLFNAGFSPPTPLRRPSEQDQAVPWATNFPAFRCWATTIRLPEPQAGWRWDHDAGDVNRKAGGVAYWRRATVDGSVIRTVLSTRTYLPELSQQQAQELNDQIPSFEKYVNRAFQVKGSAPDRAAPGQPPAEDWSSALSPCLAREEQADGQPAAGPAPEASAPAVVAQPTVPESDVDTEPRQDPAYPVSQPPYPPRSVWAREEGAVILDFVVRKDGSVDAASIGISQSSGFPALDLAAIDEAARWRFVPATKGGKPVAASHQFRVVFELMRSWHDLANEFPEMPAILRSGVEGNRAPESDPDRPITQPPYPEDALAAGNEGDVILQFTVEADGFVAPDSIVVKKSSGFPSLDQAAVNEAAVNWRFRPAILNGAPVAAPHRFRVVFALEQPAQPTE